jgi:hypothetical protein
MKKSGRGDRRFPPERQSGLTLVLDEVAQGAVIGAFSLDTEEATRNLAFFPVIQDALAAVAPLVAGGIGASAVFDCLGRNTFHRVDAPFKYNDEFQG